MLNKELRTKIQEALKNGATVTEVSNDFGILRPTVAYIAKKLFEVRDENIELFEAGVTLERKVQRLADTNRIERKLFREQARLDNIAEDLFNKALEKIGEDKVELPVVEVLDEGKIGIIQFSDLHFGEVIELPNNTFNLEIARERVLAHTIKSLRLFKSLGISKAYVVFTGDSLNSDRRLDERLTNACTRAESLIYVFNVFVEVIKLVSKEVSIIEVISIVANESRIDFDLSSIDTQLINNFDYLLHEMLRAVFHQVAFSNFSGINAIERVLIIDGVNLLIAHNIWVKRPEEAVKRAKLLYNADYLICGHIHSCLINSSFRRSGGLPGANSYSQHQLGICENVSSQNVHWVEGKVLTTIENVLN